MKFKLLVLTVLFCIAPIFSMEIDKCEDSDNDDNKSFVSIELHPTMNTRIKTKINLNDLGINNFISKKNKEIKENAESIYIIACIYGDQISKYSFLDAHSVNKKLFGEYSINIENIKKYLSELKHPLTQKPIRNIEYFTLSMLGNEFKHLCSIGDLIGNDSEKYLNIFHKNTNDLDLYQKLITKYLNEKNFKLAEEYSLLLTKQEDLKVKAFGYLQLGQIYRKKGLYNQAKGYYEEATNQKVNLLVKATAAYELGELWEGDYYRKNTVRAENYFEEAASQDVDLTIKEKAYKKLINSKLI